MTKLYTDLQKNGKRFEVTYPVLRKLNECVLQAWVQDITTHTPPNITAIDCVSQVVYCSADKSQSEFDSYFASMPWLAVAFEASEKHEELRKQFKVSKIPSLVLLNKDGSVLDLNGRITVQKDPTGALQSIFNPARSTAQTSTEHYAVQCITHILDAGVAGCGWIPGEQPVQVVSDYDAVEYGLEATLAVVKLQCLQRGAGSQLHSL